jgi:hypothetical protein
LAVSFDTPKSSTDYDVLTTGTVAGWSTAHVMVTLTVSGTNAARTATQQVFYREMNYDNTATSAALAISETLNIAITPMLHGNETVATDISFSY